MFRRLWYSQRFYLFIHLFLFCFLLGFIIFDRIVATLNSTSRDIVCIH